MALEFPRARADMVNGQEKGQTSTGVIKKCPLPLGRGAWNKGLVPDVGLCVVRAEKGGFGNLGA